MLLSDILLFTGLNIKYQLYQKKEIPRIGMLILGQVWFMKG